MVRGIQEETGASIDIQEDGTIHIAAVEGTAGKAAKDMILAIVKEPEVGEVFDGEVVGIKDFGAFVRLTPSKDGLLHISKVANGRVTEVDPKTGKISLDRLDKPDAPAGSASQGGPENKPDKPRPGQGNRRPRRSHHA